MKKVMVFGTFDILHKGHISMFEQAKNYGDFLIAVVARDETVKQIKQHTTVFDEKSRLKTVQNAPFVDKAVLGNKDDKYKIIEEQQPNIICLGYDQNAFTVQLKAELAKRKINAKIIRLGPYKEDIYKSSKIKELSR